MPYWKGEKWACYSCTKGHRSSKCTHYDRILYKVRKPGRPLNNCPHVLPDSIPPGTFVNTSAESMANGNPPKEACNCRSDLVQVAIPKAKSCSCLKPESVNTIQPPPPSTPLPMVPEANDTTQNGVKKGRIGKRANPRRKKSTVSEEAIEAAKSETAQAGSENAGTPNVGENGMIVLSRTPCTDPGWQAFDVLIGPIAIQQGVSVMKRLVSRDDPPADPNQPFGQTVSEANNYWPQRMPGAPLVSPTDGGINLSLSQNSTQNFPVTNPDYNAAYAGLGGNPPFMNPFPKPSANFFAQTPSSNVTPIPQQSVAPFSPAQSRYEQLPNLNLPLHGGGSNGCVKGAAPAPTLTNPPPDVRANEETVTVELTQQEWVAVQQARTAGVNFTELAKAISSGQLLFPTLHSQSTTATEDSNHSSSATSPYTTSARSSPPVNNGSGGSGSCSTQIKSPPPLPSTFTSHSCGCSGEKQQQRQIREEMLAAPNSPRCKCGDSCRCVPCADHPHNPAMLAHIRRNMELMDAPQQGMFDPSLGGGGGGMNSGFSPDRPLAYDGYYDDGDGDAPQDSMSDFSDFAICDYRYGNGMGGCKCGEGCTCIGCLMHGGHDGVLLDMKSSGKNRNGGGNDGGGGVRS